MAVKLQLTVELSVGLRNVRVTVPTAVRKGDPVHLYCEYELEDNERLYSIKWYKGKREFYRYTPQVHPSVQVFSTVSGIDVEEKSLLPLGRWHENPDEIHFHFDDAI
uniref:Ig-like domain-containing protein n=1 Tax=Anopheles culicifacies TaxID=139723 RepID=A0A182M290_9DIPT